MTINLMKALSKFLQIKLVCFGCHYSNTRPFDECPYCGRTTDLTEEQSNDEKEEQHTK